jgi:alkylation response protein AidB-like acyl-CoA dehydrogenase
LSRSTDNRWRDQFRHVDLHPAGRTPAATFEAAAAAARAVAQDCLPLGIGIVMHLYPLCASRCVPLPWWSKAGLQRSKLLRAIDRGSLILANAGSERATGAHAPVTLLRTREGVRVDGTYDYVSLANVADIVFFSVPIAGSACTLFCAADLRKDSVRIGGAKFAGSMARSDTCSVTFANHLVPPDRYLIVPGETALQCMAQYQRSWFQLLLGESYLARIERLHRQWNLTRPVEQLATLNELSLLREYALRLLNEAAAPSAVESLSRVTAAMKLRVSWLAQSTAAALRKFDEESASELGYLKRQPICDDRIMRSLGWVPASPQYANTSTSCPHPVPT